MWSRLAVCQNIIIIMTLKYIPQATTHASPNTCQWLFLCVVQRINEDISHIVLRVALYFALNWTRVNYIIDSTRAQVKRRSFHAPNQIQLSVAVERYWSDVESNVAPNMPLLIEAESKQLRRSNSAK